MKAPLVKPEMEILPILMSFEEIIKQFPDEWVLMANPKYDDKDITIIEGIPLLHSKNKKEVYYYGRGKKDGYDVFTVVFTGSFKSSGRAMTGIWRTFPWAFQLLQK